jgi:hypothetical protein
MPRHYKKSLPAVDWELLVKVFPTHREHILRIHKSPEKLLRLSQRLVASKVHALRSLRGTK